jgi:predicted ArsR family transcriptional regulator
MERILSEYFKKCFLAVDGLWFMMVEQADSFDKALEMDRRVWEVLPKIQARKIKALLNLECSVEALAEALRFKLDAEDFVNELRQEDGRIEITIRRCPWLALLKGSNRQHLAERIADAICTIEYKVFAEEFVKGLDFKILSRRCSGHEVCTLILEETRAGT